MQLFKLILIRPKNAVQGFLLTELLVALVMGGIVLSLGATAFISLLNQNSEVETKSIRHNSLTKTLNYIQDDIKASKQITQEPRKLGSNCSTRTISSNECLVLTFPASYGVQLNNKCTSTTTEPKVYYGFDDISRGNQTWLKPGVLRRKVICENDAGNNVATNWMVVGDGLVSVNEKQPNTSCTQDGLTNWVGDNTIYGRNRSNKGGFRFCLENSNNRLVRVFLYGHIIGGNSNNQIMVNTVSFARAN